MFPFTIVISNYDRFVHSNTVRVVQISIALTVTEIVSNYDRRILNLEFRCRVKISSADRLIRCYVPSHDVVKGPLRAPSEDGQ
jgi:hypothetical protein